MDAAERPVAPELTAVVLAAGSGTRLRPLTYLRPKALCPVGGEPLVDHVLARVAGITGEVAVNVHHGRDRLVPHVRTRARVSVEDPEPLETAGALGALRAWIDGRDVLTLNADTWHPDDLRSFVTGWDRERVRLLVVRAAGRGDFGDRRFAGAALLPWAVVRALPAERLGLYPAVLAPAYEAGRLDLHLSDVAHHDCGTPAEYLEANLAAAQRSGTGAALVGPGAVVEGEVVDSVVWPGARVRRGERLVRAVRATHGVTVHVAAPERPAGVSG